MKRVIMYLCVIMFVFVCGNAVSKDVSGRKKILVVVRKTSEFKEDILSKIIDRYDDKYSIERISLKKLKRINEDDYEVILIVDNYMAWSFFNGRTKIFIKKAANIEKIVLFMTTGDPDLEYEYRGVDAVTSASVGENETVVIEELTEKIDKILGE